MSGLQRDEATINGVDVREQGNALRVATNTPHLVSLGTGRLSTAVTLHPIKQGRVIIGSDPTCDIYVAGTGVCSLHCRVENSHGVVTLYPVNGSTLVDGLLVDKPTRMSQGSMLTIGRSNYLRFNHPEEAKLMKSVLPTMHLSMAPVQFTPNEDCVIPSQALTSNHNESGLPNNMQCYQSENFQKNVFKDNSLNALDQELDMTIREMSRRKPPVAPRKHYKDLDQVSDSNSDQESLNSYSQKNPKTSSIMAKVSKFEYYAKSQQKSIGRSQFYTSHTDTNHEYSPKVFSSNSLTVNTPAKDVLGGKNVPTNYAVKTTNNLVPENNHKVMILNDNNSVEARNCSYANVAIRNKITKIDDIVKNFDENVRNGDITNRVLKKVNNVEKGNDSFQNRNAEHVYGKINEPSNPPQVSRANYSQPSVSLDRNPQFSPVYANSSHVERNLEAENKRMQAYQERIKDEEQKDAENARLEEILNMCAEYERQISSGLPLTPTEKRSQNKIITNGSLPRSIGLNNPNFVQTSDGYFRFDTSQNRMQNNSASKPLAIHRNLSNYENIDVQQLSLPVQVDSQKTPEITIRNQSSYENVGRMDEIGIPINEEFDSPTQYDPISELSSPVMIRKLTKNIQSNNEKNIANGDLHVVSTSPIGSPYENVFYNRNNTTQYANLKPKSPNTQSPRTRIKTTFAHKNLPSPQYFIFPTPPPIEDDSKMLPNKIQDNSTIPYMELDMADISESSIGIPISPSNETSKEYSNRNIDSPRKLNYKCTGIEKQLSLEEEIPMIDDSDLTNDLEFRFSQIILDARDENLITSSPKSVDLNNHLNSSNTSNTNNDTSINKSFYDVKRELMADIPELEEFERDLNQSKREKILKNVQDELKSMDSNPKVEESKQETIRENENIYEIKTAYDALRESRKKVLAEIYEIKCKMSEIRSQEDDILRELELEKALIKGEYDSEIAILNIEQMKKAELGSKAKKFEEEIQKCKEQQEARQNDMKDRVEVATLKVERIEKDMRNQSATLEELQNAQDILDNEAKIYEDLEFQHLEEESEMLAYREDLQNEIIALSKKIESQKNRILTLKSEANNNLTSALDETRVLQAEYVRQLNQVENLTGKVQTIEKELKSLVVKLNDLERAQSPDSVYSIEKSQTRAKSGEFGYSTQSSDSDDLDLAKVTNFDSHRKQLNDKFNSIDQMSQSMIVDIEKRDISDLIDDVTKQDAYSPAVSRDNSISFDSSHKSDRLSESPSKSSSSSKEKKGFWERNFDSLTRMKNKDKKSKSPPQVDIMSQSLNENMFYNNEHIESENFGNFEKFNSLRLSKSKKDKQKATESNGPMKSSSSSKIPTFAAFSKIMKKDSFGKKSKEGSNNVNNKENSNKNHESESDNSLKNRYVKNSKSFNSDNKYKAKSQVTPEKAIDESLSPKIDAKNETENERSSFADSLEGDLEEMPNYKGHNVTFDDLLLKSSKDNNKTGPQSKRILHRKSCGDEPGIISDYKMTDSGKIPSQDDIDRISKVTIDAPILSSDTDMNSLGRKTLDSLMEIERNRMTMLEQQGCQVIENEREKISELKRRVQDETKKHWESQRETKCDISQNYQDTDSANFSLGSRSDRLSPSNEYSYTNSEALENADSLVKDSVSESENRVLGDYGREKEQAEESLNATNSYFDESSGMMSSSIEELQARHSRTDSFNSRGLEEEKRSNGSRPLSDTSDISNDNILSPLSGASVPRRSRRAIVPYFARTDLQRPLTRYLPIDRDDFDLRRHIESAGHQVELCPHVTINSSSCRGYLHKLGAKFHTWSKRWFVFDRDSKTFVYYWDKSEKKPRGGAYFQVIEEVYLDHGNTSKSPNPQTTFVVKTRQRRYYLMSPSGEAARIWIDVIFTGAQGYTEYLE